MWQWTGFRVKGHDFFLSFFIRLSLKSDFPNQSKSEIGGKCAIKYQLIKKENERRKGGRRNIRLTIR